MKQTDTLLNFSGGLDSTHCLWKYLRDNPHKKLLVHHCHLLTSFNRHEQESRAVRDVLKWLDEHGLKNYEYVETTADIRQLGVKPLDGQVVAFINGVMFQNPKYREIKFNIVCTPRDEFERLGKKQLQEQWDDFAHLRSLPRLTMAKPRVQILTNTYPVRDMRKTDIVRATPSDLVKLTWSCRTPRKGRVCGECHTCRQLGVKK